MPGMAEDLDEGDGLCLAEQREKMAREGDFQGLWQEFVPNKYLPNPHDPFSDPALRWRRCRYLVRHGRLPSPLRDNDATRDGWRYLRDRRACRNHTDRERLALLHPAVLAAHRFFRRAAPLQRAELEARLLARQADDVIAAHCGLSAAAVGNYHALYFNVRDALDAEAYIFNVVLGPKVHDGLCEADVDILLKLLGYAHGPLMVDAALRYFCKPPALPRPLDGLDAAALAELCLQLQVRALILTMVAQAHTPAGRKSPRMPASLPKASVGDDGPILVPTGDGAAPIGHEEVADLPVAAFLRERVRALTPADPLPVLPLDRSALREAPDQLEASLPALCG